MSATVHCPALLISAPASGQGKTTLTAALARFYRQQGKDVRIFKTGPDFLDPMILKQAAGQPVYQLDLWMGGEQHCRQLLYNAAREADLILIEGVMGLFDGAPSSADLTALFAIPVLAVINAAAMAQTFGALVQGLASYKKNLAFAGVIANRVASPTHAEMLAESMPDNVAYLGALYRDASFELPSRHLGLVQAEEIADLDMRIDRAAQALRDANFNYQPEPVRFEQPEWIPLAQDLAGIKIAVARDAAFAFIYRANLELLQAMGAELHFFSPLSDTTLPPADSLYFPGGYPELHLQQLAQNKTLHHAIREHHAQGKPIMAECGGMLYLFDSLTDKEGQSGTMVGLLSGHARMQKQLANLDLQTVALPEGQLRGHTFHHSKLETRLEASVRASGSRKRSRGEAVYRNKRLHASYLHLYFPSNPDACARLFRP